MSVKLWVVLDWLDHDEVVVDSVWSTKVFADERVANLGGNAECSEHELDV